MSTAHKATWKSAKGGSNQGGNVMSKYILAITKYDINFTVRFTLNSYNLAY